MSFSTDVSFLDMQDVHSIGTNTLHTIRDAGTLKYLQIAKKMVSLLLILGYTEPMISKF